MLTNHLLYLDEQQEQLTGTFLIVNNSIRRQDVYSGFGFKKRTIWSWTHGIGLCKNALNLAIENKSSQALEQLLQQFIEAQMKTL